MREEAELKEPDPGQEKPLTGLPEFRKLRVNCMIAGVPTPAVEIYGKIGDDAPWLGTEGHVDPRASHILSAILADAAAQLIRDALYHPMLTRFTYRWRVKRLRSMAWELYGPGPDMSQWTSLPVFYRRWRQIQNTKS
jgi:hypothetical protein